MISTLTYILLGFTFFFLVGTVLVLCKWNSKLTRRVDSLEAVIDALSVRVNELNMKEKRDIEDARDEYASDLREMKTAIDSRISKINGKIDLTFDSLNLKCGELNSALLTHCEEQDGFLKTILEFTEGVEKRNKVSCNSINDGVVELSKDLHRINKNVDRHQEILGEVEVTLHEMTDGQQSICEAFRRLDDKIDLALSTVLGDQKT